MQGLVGRFGVFFILAIMLCSCGGNSAQPELAPQAAGTTVRDISAELRRLDQLEAPEGTDTARFDELKQELRRLLEEYADGKVVSQAPGAAHGKVDDFSLTVLPAGDAHMEWSYFNRGDYDQNSEVNVSDLTPVGRWLGNNPSSGEWNKAAVADGDRNNEVNLADVTPIGQNFLMSVKGYRVLEAATATATDWQVVAEVLFADGELTAGSPIQRYTYELGSPQNEMFYCVAPFNNDGLGAPSEPVQYKAPKPKVNSVSPLSISEGGLVNFVASTSGVVQTWLWQFDGGVSPAASTEQSPQVSVGAPGVYGASLTVGNSYGSTEFQFSFQVKANQAPNAVLQLSATQGSAPLNVTLDAGASSDADGEIAGYEWDFEGDGTFDETTTALQPSVQHTYSSQGSFNPTVKVTDNFGASSSKSMPLSVGGAVEGSWNLMVWIAADNNLADFGAEDIEELEQFGSDENINILVGFDIDPTWMWQPYAGTDKVHFIKVVKDSTPYSINTIGDPANKSFARSGYNSASPANVRAFVDWCNASFPADHSCLVLWDHGNGWRLGGSGERPVSSVGPQPEPIRSVNPLNQRPKPRSREELRGIRPGIMTRDASGVLADDSDGPLDITSNAAIVEALDGLHFDIIAFDACNMGHVEALYEYSPLCDWLVASELLVPGPGYAYDRLLQKWQQNFPASAEDVGGFFVDCVIDEYGSDFWDVNHAVFDSARIAGLVADLAALASAVTANAEAESAGFKNAMNSSFEPLDGDGVRDLQAFLTNYAAQSSNSSIDSAISVAQGSVQSCISYFRQSKSPNSQGLGIYLPSASFFSASLQSEYDQLPFDDATGWLAMLKAIGLEGGGGGGLQVNWDPGDRVQISWTKPSDDMDLYIYEPNGAYSAAWEGTDLFSSNLTASGDSADVGPFEWLKLKNTAMNGPYELDIVFYDSQSFETVMVTVRVFDSSGALKEEVGIVPMLYPGYYIEGYCTLTLN